MTFSGHCLCRAVTYIVDTASPLVVYCHCDDCQRNTGSTYALILTVPKHTVHIQGPLRTFSNVGSSGLAVHRSFCGVCGSPISDVAESAPEEISIKGGSLEPECKRWLQPSEELWTASKLSFCQERLPQSHLHMPE
ncbi:hypothetical protein BO82DRAFT_414629 [Aspergillus uvarum CBS 121591]|uniref:CENP-V/GFA domain-containing protein n=1 Tax=Aspergillus uvarum CBS 121591 TaxID=1448315 RepID=A0A319C973_9EURO|nr:hypothetical protein BO82DRAFT_414629 [Aspergillus uvarum CBS 121591]PYH81794.1 hypothetical protein BO82DRAFT_414629 [Aspergillus uvarum CBS 121591]